jgi:hypothetical protein
MNLDSLIAEGFLENEKEYWQRRDDLMKEYAGKHIAYHNGEVIAVADSLVEAMNQVGQLKCPSAYITQVGQEDLELAVRRLEFEYDQTYRFVPLPLATVTFLNYNKDSPIEYPDVIPDTGADICMLPMIQCERIDLFSSPCRRYRLRGVTSAEVSQSLMFLGYVQLGTQEYLALISPYAGNDKILGRDVMNQLTVTFCGKAGKVIFKHQ